MGLLVATWCAVPRMLAASALRAARIGPRPDRKIAFPAQDFQFRYGHEVKSRPTSRSNHANFDLFTRSTTYVRPQVLSGALIMFLARSSV